VAPVAFKTQTPAVHFAIKNNLGKMGVKPGQPSKNNKSVAVGKFRMIGGLIFKICTVALNLLFAGNPFCPGQYAFEK
jgi:hypothetical protein